MNQQGDGIFRKDGLEPPKFRNLLKQVGDEKITSLTIWREPISVNGVLKALKLNKSYDDLFHLALNINGKYNLDKQAVLHFERGKPKGETLNIPSKNITINELIDRTRKRMGPRAYTRYSSKNNNCQDFLLNVLQANGLLTTDASKFIKQDIEKIFQGLPKYAEAVSDFITGTQAVVDRVLEGEGKRRAYQYPMGCNFYENQSILF